MLPPGSHAQHRARAGRAHPAAEAGTVMFSPRAAVTRPAARRQASPPEEGGKDPGPDPASAARARLRARPARGTVTSRDSRRAAHLSGRRGDPLLAPVAYGSKTEVDRAHRTSYKLRYEQRRQFAYFGGCRCSGQLAQLGTTVAIQIRTAVRPSNPRLTSQKPAPRAASTIQASPRRSRSPACTALGRHSALSHAARTG